MWVEYKNEALAPHHRNADVKLLIIGGIETFPFKWTSDKNLAKHSFKECYEEVLLPRNKYTKDWKVLTDEFYGGGGYTFLSLLEDNFNGCSSLCEMQLFHLTIDVKEGKPKQECLAVIQQHFDV